MLVTLKTLQEDIFTVEIDPSQTVKYFKEKIEKLKGHEFPAKNMKLMYAGKFLVDNKRVSDYNVEEKKFVIVVVKKPKTIVKEEPVEQESSSEMDQDRTNGQRNADENLIRHITELGFSRAEVEAALNASYNNPDRAVEYLINGAFPSSSNEDAETEARRRNPDHISDSSDARLLRQISNSGPPSPGSENMPNQERIMQLFTEAMTESRNQTRVQDRLLEQDQDLINQSYAEMEASELCRGSSGAAGSTIPFSSGGATDSTAMLSSDSMFESFSNAFHEAQALSFAGNLMDRDHEAIERPNMNEEPHSSSEINEGSSMNVQTNACIEDSIIRITECGFLRADVEEALNATNNDPDRAVEYLINKTVVKQEPESDSDMEEEEGELILYRRALDTTSDEESNMNVHTVAHRSAEDRVLHYITEVGFTRAEINEALNATNDDPVGAVDYMINKKIEKDREAGFYMQEETDEENTTASDEPEGGPESSSEIDQERSANRERTMSMFGPVCRIMGFAQAEVDEALNACNNNPHGAIDYLFDNCFSDTDRERAAMEASERAAQRRIPHHISISLAVELLRRIPNYGPPIPGSENMQEGIFQVPLYAEAVTGSNNQTSTSDRLIENDQYHPWYYAQMESEVRGESSGASASAMPFSPGAIPDPTNMFSEAVFDPFNNTVHEAQAVSFAGTLMDRDHDAIERLKQLGFSDQKVIEAYFVCEKNENAAANYLISQNFN